MKDRTDEPYYHLSFTYKIEYKPEVTIDEDGSPHIRAELLLTQTNEHKVGNEKKGFDRSEVEALLYKGAYFRINIREVIVHALRCLERESDLWAEISKLDWADKNQFDMSRPPKHLLGEVGKLTEMLRKAMMKRLCFHPKRGGSKASYDLTDLGDYYEKTLTATQGAKERYKKNADSPVWMQMVKLEYPDMDNDLIARLSGEAKDLSDEHRRQLQEKGGGASASDIAVEWAARLCGAPPYRYTLGYLVQRKSGKVKRAKNNRNSNHD